VVLPRCSDQPPEELPFYGVLCRKHINTNSVTDITNIRTAERWLYLCVGLDFCSGLVDEFEPERQLVLEAVLMAA
jgi:hypothetical protein